MRNFRTEYPGLEPTSYSLTKIDKIILNWQMKLKLMKNRNRKASVRKNL